MASLLTLLLGYAFGGLALRGLAADADTLRFGRIYLAWFLPALACMYPGTALSAGLRATGVVMPTMLLQSASVLLNAVLAPVLVAGWGTGHPFGVAGAGIASTIAGTLSTAIMLLLVPRVQHYIGIHLRALTPDFAAWRRLMAIGLPAAGELFMIFIVMGAVYRVIRGFGPEAQAGFGIASRIMQSIFLPAMAVSFAAAPVAGQNFGAGAFARVRSTFWHTAVVGSGIMLTLTLLCQTRPDWLVAPFTQDPRVAATAVDYLRIMSWNFVGSGLAFACSGMFQGLGDTTPSFIASASRLVTYVAPAFWLAGLPGAQLKWIWHLSVMSVAVQATTSLIFLYIVFEKKLGRPGALPLDPVVRSTLSRDGA